MICTSEALPRSIRCRCSAAERRHADLCRRAPVLLVDDEPDLLELYERMLRSRFSTVSVNCARDAHSLLLESSIYSAIVCDLAMRGMDGVALYELVNEARPEVAERFVFVTGGAFNTRLQDFVSRVSNFVLSKPFHADELVHVVSTLAQGRTKRCPWH